MEQYYREQKNKPRKPLSCIWGLIFLTDGQISPTPADGVSLKTNQCRSKREGRRKEGGNSGRSWSPSTADKWISQQLIWPGWTLQCFLCALTGNACTAEPLRWGSPPAGPRRGGSPTGCRQTSRAGSSLSWCATAALRLLTWGWQKPPADPPPTWRMQSTCL